MNKKLFYFLCLLALAFNSRAQSTVIATPSPPSAAGSLVGTTATITFAVENTNSYSMELTDVAFYRGAATSGWTYNLWYSSTSLSGLPGNVNTPNWTMVSSTTASVVSSLAVYPLFSGMSFVIPANTTYRFAVQAIGGSMDYGTAGTVPNTNSGAGVNLLRGDATISGQAVGYSGDQTGPTFTPRFFVGSITVKQAIKPCTGTPEGGSIVASDTSLCANKGYDYTLINSTHSVDDTGAAGYTWYWEKSIDGVVWSFLPGSVDKDTIKGIFTEDVWYRMYVICSYGGDTAKTNTVHIKTKAAEKCYCYSQSAGGNTDSSDIGALTIYNFSVDLKGPHLLNPLSVKRRTDYTDLPPIELYIDSSYKFEIKHIMKGNFHHNAKITVFMDFNNNQVYDVEHEKVFTGFTDATGFVLTPVITIPDSAIEKYPTGMRIILNDDAGPNAASDSACGGYTSGETEDYMVLFQRAFPTGVNATSLLSGLKLYPNPSEGRVNISFNASKAVNKLTLSVTTVTGMQVLQQSYEGVKGKFEQQVDLGSQSKGVYFIQLNADGQKTTQRVVLQ